MSVDGEPHPQDDGWVAAVHVAGDKHPAGCGVVLDDLRVLTCAHVLPEDEHEIWVTFPKTEEIVPLRRVKKVIRPAAGSPEALDLVILLLAEPVPAGVPAAPVRCPRPRDLVGNPWWAFGFPPGNPLGSFAEGNVGGTLAHGWVRLDRTSRYPVEPGFSGGGLWSPDYQAVVGIVGNVNRAQGDGHAITFYQADQCFPDQKLRTLAERYKASDAGPVALTQWGWSLAGDPEAKRHWRPRARGVSIDSERGYRFRGRTAALTAITDWLTRDTAERRVLLVTGDPGAGKSAVLGRIVTTADADAARQLPPDDTAVRAEIGSVACAVHAKGRTALEIAKEIAKAASAALPERPEDFLPALRDALAERSAPSFNVIIDALDESPEARAVIAKVILPLAETCADVGARVVVGTRRHDAEGDLLTAFGPAAQTVDLNAPDYFTQDDLAAYALATLQLSGDERPGNPYTNVKIATPMAERIAALSRANFLVAGLVARTHGLYDEAPADPEELSFSPSVDAAMREYLSRIPDVNGASAETLLTALAYAESPGLPVSLWRVAIRALGTGDIPEASLRKFARSKAASFLVESTGEHANAQFRLFHQALNDALLSTRSMLARRHEDEQALTRAFMAAGQQPGWDRAPAYLLRSLPSHAARAGLIDALLAEDDYLLHADLLRVRVAAEQATSSAGRQRARLLRLSPNEAITADAPIRAAMFSVTEALEAAGDSYRRRSAPKIPYSAVWAAAQNSQEHLILRGHNDKVNAVCAYTAADGTPRLATTSDDETIRTWNPVTGTETHTLRGHNGRVLSVCAYTAADGTPRLATTSDDKTIRTWNTVTGTQIHTLHGHNGRILSVCAFATADGTTRLATASDDGTACIWNTDSDTETHTLHGHSESIRSVCAFTAADSAPRLATTSVDKTIRIWEADTGTKVRVLHGHDGAVNAICAFTAADGTTRLATASDDGTVCIWNPVNVAETRILDGHNGRVLSVCTYTTPDGTPRLATASADETRRIWDPGTGDELRALHGYDDDVNAICPFTAASGASRLAAVSDNGTIRIWNPANGAQIHTLYGGGGNAICAYTAADGTPRLATTSDDDGTIYTWDPDTVTQIRTLHGHNAPVNAMCAYTADGEPRLASASNDGTIRIWNPELDTSPLVIPVRDSAWSVDHADGLLFVGLETGLLAIRLHL